MAFLRLWNLDFWEFLHSAYHQECHSYDYYHCSYYQSIENVGVIACIHRGALHWQEAKP